jgi:hypothetical protein
MMFCGVVPGAQVFALWKMVLSEIFFGISSNPDARLSSLIPAQSTILAITIGCVSAG